MEYQELIEELVVNILEGLGLIINEDIKLDYIKETIATMMDVQPIQVVGKEHPAKEEKRKGK